MKLTKRIEEARQRHDEAISALEEYGAKIDALPDDTKQDERDFHGEVLAALEEKTAKALEKLEREVAFQKAREASAFVMGDGGVKVGEEEKTYRPAGRHSYFRDLVVTSVRELGIEDPAARERLTRHASEIRTPPSFVMSPRPTQAPPRSSPRSTWAHSGSTRKWPVVRSRTRSRLSR